MQTDLQSKPELKLNVTEQQFRAIGHVVLQWAHLESEIVHELFWLYARSEHKKKKRPEWNAKFSVKASRWVQLARRSYKKHSDLIQSAKRISGQAITIKKERDVLAHGTISGGGFFKHRQGRLIDVSDAIGTPRHLEGLACRIAKISADLMRHHVKLQKRFRKSWD